jgi:hypothetical protein
LPLAAIAMVLSPDWKTTVPEYGPESGSNRGGNRHRRDVHNGRGGTVYRGVARRPRRWRSR